jgi:hypothetical protein
MVLTFKKSIIKMKINPLFRLTLLVIVTLSIIAPLKAQEQTTPKRESIEWLDVWMPNTNDSGLPRILLIGNSITRGYYPEVQKMLAGKAYVARLATSKSLCDSALLKEIELIMGYYKFDIVHFNNGLHGFDYTEEDYGKYFPGFVEAIRKMAPHAKLIWATTTPMRTKADVTLFDPKTERIKVRNKIALDYIAKHKDIRIDDLWAFTINNPTLYQGGDGTHPNPEGFKTIGQKVAAELTSVLAEK